MLRTGHEAYNSISRGNRAWVLDSGIDLQHEDLNVSGKDSKSFVSWGSGRNSANDDNGHGTHVAGTIGAIKGNGKGVVGVAAGAELVAVKVFGPNGSARLSDILSGIDYIAQKAKTGDVTNMSFGGGVSLSLDQATINLANKGVLISIAAGNSSDDASKYSPARTGDKHANIFAIAAMRQGDSWASFSNFGQPPVQFIAPGVDVLSTWPGNSYHSLNGTSMSAPHVAGILLVKGNVLSDGNVLGPNGKNYP
ncbi:MAG: S8 family serine peptidase, partial [Bacteroidetes bacterium]|nr:S8 family serine peptidase [Bacteroidota bacterium]